MPKLTTRDYKRSSRGAGAAKLKEFGLGVVVGAVLASAAFVVAGARARHHAAEAARTHAGADTQNAAPHAPAADDTSSDSPDPAPPSASASTPQSASGRAKAPQYDFYRMLPRFKVPVTRDDDHTGRAVPPPAASLPQSTAASGPSYILQVGSYRSTAQADQVRARLAKVGISAQVQHIVDGSGSLNRVRIGPLSDPELTRVREQLRTANIHALLLRADR